MIFLWLYLFLVVGCEIKREIELRVSKISVLLAAIILIILVVVVTTIEDKVYKIKKHNLNIANKVNKMKRIL